MTIEFLLRDQEDENQSSLGLDATGFKPWVDKIQAALFAVLQVVHQLWITHGGTAQ
ncbi:hypothetical protein NDI52_32285 [Leptolyngbya sp. PL-A3]|uniref:hypothetical protein n=1 Tax=Leptolyngbya sp. PL-A3 TaxID=2933911 RepID=UPI003299D4CE